MVRGNHDLYHVFNSSVFKHRYMYVRAHLVSLKYLDIQKNVYPFLINAICVYWNNHNLDVKRVCVCVCVLVIVW